MVMMLRSNPWYCGQWDQSSSSYGQWYWKQQDEWKYSGWSAGQWSLPEKGEEGEMKQFHGEKLFRILEHVDVEKEYLSKITGMILGS